MLYSFRWSDGRAQPETALMRTTGWIVTFCPLIDGKVFQTEVQSCSSPAKICNMKMVASHHVSGFSSVFQQILAAESLFWLPWNLFSEVLVQWGQGDKVIAENTVAVVNQSKGIIGKSLFGLAPWDALSCFQEGSLLCVSSMLTCLNGMFHFAFCPVAVHGSTAVQPEAVHLWVW